jgi:hypothetical protein
MIQVCARHGAVPRKNALLLATAPVRARPDPDRRFN